MADNNMRTSTEKSPMQLTNCNTFDFFLLFLLLMSCKMHVLYLYHTIESTQTKRWRAIDGRLIPLALEHAERIIIQLVERWIAGIAMQPLIPMQPLQRILTHQLPDRTGNHAANQRLRSRQSAC